MENFLISVRAFIAFLILLGIYVFGITIISNTFMADKANGSLLTKNKAVIGSSLIAQEFHSVKYFHSRFSAVDYNAVNSGASNLAPSNKNLIEGTKKRIAKVRLENKIPATTEIPADMVLESGSGLDPHISYENALLQMPRVADARHLSPKTVENLIDKNIDDDFIGIWGQEAVNVLKLNLSLDNAAAPGK
jgi:potassium-transporting ATPase KdpC subunit